MERITYPDLMLAVSLSARGFAYVFFEGSETPFDWGVVEIKGKEKNQRTGKQVEKLLRCFRPHALILEDLRPKAAKRPDRTKKLSLHLQHLAHCEGIDVAIYDRAAIRRAFAPLGARTKVEIADAIALAVPAFGHRLPPVRRLWMNEDPRQMLFDAAALGLTHAVGPTGPDP